jgi:hypothetical protein
MLGVDENGLGPRLVRCLLRVCSLALPMPRPTSWRTSRTVSAQGSPIQKFSITWRFSGLVHLWNVAAYPHPDCLVHALSLRTRLLRQPVGSDEQRWESKEKLVRLPDSGRAARDLDTLPCMGVKLLRSAPCVHATLMTNAKGGVLTWTWDAWRTCSLPRAK